MKEYHLSENLLENFKKHLFEEEKSKNTLDKYMRDIQAFFTFCNGRINKDTAIAYKQKLIENGYAVRSINSMIASINGLFMYERFHLSFYIPRKCIPLF